MVNILGNGKGGPSPYKKNRKRRSRLLLLLLLLLLSITAFIIIYRNAGDRLITGGKDKIVPEIDISAVIFDNIPKEDRAVRPRPAIDKAVMKSKGTDEKSKTADPNAPKRIPGHPILEIIGPDGKTLMKKK